MNHLFFALMDQDPDNYALPLGSMSPQARERLLVLGAIAVVIFCVLCWAAFFRQRPRHKRGHIKRDRRSLRKSFADGWAELKRVFAQQERERKRMSHRPRNPTRAEVGGLPAARDESNPAATGDTSRPRSNF
jgi:type VI protein secretion system component VasK